MIESIGTIIKNNRFLKPFNLLLFSVFFVVLNFLFLVLSSDNKMLIIKKQNSYKEGNNLITLKLDSNEWSDLRSNLNYVYIDRFKMLTVEVDESLLDLVSVDYYITNQVLNLNELNNLDISAWTVYQDQILIDQTGVQIVYIKVTDDNNNITYINSDFLVLKGYTQNNLIIGRNSSSYQGKKITNKSTISINTSYNGPTESLNNYTHNLITNILLPKDSIITLIDHVKNKVYQYQIPTVNDNYNYNNSCEETDLTCTKVATYQFSLFKEVGTLENKPFVESDYISEGIINEDFTIVLDFAKTNFSLNYLDTALYVELHNSNGEMVRPTLYNTLKKFDIFSSVNEESVESKLTLTTDFSEENIVLNTDINNDINITSKIIYKKSNGLNIYDTRYENKKIGLAIHLEDNEGNIINRDYLKNIIFKMDNELYSPSNDNVIRIKLDNATIDVTKKLTIIGNESVKLEEGTYYLKINNYISNDGYYYDELNNMELSIPVIIESQFSLNYGFNVIMDDANRIIEKNNEQKTVKFKILQTSDLTSPSVRVSLYKKDILSAYNQDYSIVDLKNYINDELEYIENNTYLAIANIIQYESPDYLYNEFELNLITNNFENNGYMFVFDLYDNDKKMATISKKIIVKRVLNEEKI